MARVRLMARVTGLMAGAVLTTCLALAVAAPASMASAGRPAEDPAAPAGPSGVAAKAAAIENASTGALLWSRGLNTERPMASITKVMTALVVIVTLDGPGSITTADTADPIRILNWAFGLLAG